MSLVPPGPRQPVAAQPATKLTELTRSGRFHLAAPESRLDVPSVETTLKYEGYLRRQESEISKRAREEHCRIPGGFSYSGVPGLSAEVVQRLSQTRPETLGQAMRVPGVTPAAMAVLSTYVSRYAEACRSGEKLAKRARKAGLNLPKSAISGLEAYFELLKKWNQKVSLTSLPVAQEGEEALDRLLIEPALAAQYLPNPSAVVIDIGSGGGSPAIPMKLVAPGIALRMVESKTRKAAFLREAIRHLELSDTKVEAARVEELLIRPELHEAADVVTVRAVRIERKLLSGIQAFLKPGGLLFLFRSGDAATDVELSNDSLRLEASHTLLPQLQSRLTAPCAMFHVEQGTSLKVKSRNYRK